MGLDEPLDLTRLGFTVGDRELVQPVEQKRGALFLQYGVDVRAQVIELAGDKVGERLIGMGRLAEPNKQGDRRTRIGKRRLDECAGKRRQRRGLAGTGLAEHDGAADLQELCDGVLELARLDHSLVFTRPWGVLELGAHDNAVQPLSRHRRACNLGGAREPRILVRVDQFLERSRSR